MNFLSNGGSYNKARTVRRDFFDTYFVSIDHRAFFLFYRNKIFWALDILVIVIDKHRLKIQIDLYKVEKTNDCPLKQTWNKFLNGFTDPIQLHDDVFNFSNIKICNYIETQLTKHQ